MAKLSGEGEDSGEEVEDRRAWLEELQVSSAQALRSLEQAVGHVGEPDHESLEAKKKVTNSHQAGTETSAAFLGSPRSAQYNSTLGANDWLRSPSPGRLEETPSPPRNSPLVNTPLRTGRQAQTSSLRLPSPPPATPIASTTLLKTPSAPDSLQRHNHACRGEVSLCLLPSVRPFLLRQVFGSLAADMQRTVDHIRDARRRTLPKGCSRTARR